MRVSSQLKPDHYHTGVHLHPERPPAGDLPMAKICQICGTDCTNKPRTKDAKGRYFCKACYERALRAQKQKEAQRQTDASDEAAPRGDDAAQAAAGEQAAPTPHQPEPRTSAKRSAKGRPEFEGSLLEAALEDAAAEETARAQTKRDDELLAAGEPPKICPKCSAEVAFDAVICTNCGFNFQTGRAAAAPGGTTEERARERKAERRREAVEQFTTPGGIAFLVLVLFGVLLVGAVFVPVLALVYLGAWLLLGVTVWAWVLVRAFQDGLLHGLASFVVPLYAYVYLFVFCEDARPKLLFGVHLLAAGAYVALAVLLGPDRLPGPVPTTG